MNVESQAMRTTRRATDTPHRCRLTLKFWTMVAGLTGLATGAQFATAAPPTNEDPAYTRVITQRAERIVERLHIDDSARATRIRDLIADQYRNLSAIHDARDARIAEARQSPGADSTIAEAWGKAVRDEASIKLFDLHRRFVSRLAAELSPEQVEKVKDGMTYGVVQATYRRYLELLPNLTDEQKAVILANLIEAREHAMDAGSSEEKHGWFRKYKGRINNYISAEGYDMNQAERDWAARQ